MFYVTMSVNFKGEACTSVCVLISDCHGVSVIYIRAGFNFVFLVTNSS